MLERDERTSRKLLGEKDRTAKRRSAQPEVRGTNLSKRERFQAVYQTNLEALHREECAMAAWSRKVRGSEKTPAKKRVKRAD